MDRQWVGESIGFTQWLRLETDPEMLRSISLSFAQLDPTVARTVLDRLGLPVAPGDTLTQVTEVLGPVLREKRFVADRASYDFRVGDDEAYLIQCTIHQSEGLMHMVVMRGDYCEV